MLEIRLSDGEWRVSPTDSDDKILSFHDASGISFIVPLVTEAAMSCAELLAMSGEDLRAKVAELAAEAEEHARENGGPPPPPV